ncbi:hypothetical protein D3C85_1704140 [compost metagenome]
MYTGFSRGGVPPQVFNDGPFFVDIGHDSFFADVGKADFLCFELILVFMLEEGELQLLKQHLLQFR